MAMGFLETDQSPISTLAVTGISLFVAYTVFSVLVSAFSSESRFLRRQVWVGEQKGLLSSIRTNLGSITGTRAFIYDAYKKHSKRNTAFALPQFGTEPVLILPPSKVKQVLQKPDQDVNLHKILLQTVAVKYTGDNDLSLKPLHLDIVRNQLTRKLPQFTADVHGELLLGFEKQWKVKHDEWTAIPVADTCVRIISRAANRVFSGTELCRNQEFLDATRNYGQGIFTQAALINMTPNFLKPLVALVVTRGNKILVQICKKYATPVIERRIQDLKAGKKDTPNDALQWLIEESMNRDARERDPDVLTRRLMRLNMVAIHTTSITITNVLLDLYSSSRCEEFVSGLREEVERVIKVHGGLDKKTAVNELFRIDSAIKESMRVSSLAIIALARLVTAKDGIDLGDDLHVPYNVRIAMPSAAIHHDPDFYARPDDYDAFRFSRSREEYDGNGQVIDKKAQGTVTTNDAFLSFGHGRHACPGRFFAVQEMKLMLAHIVLKYDVKMDGPRPKNTDIKGISVPSDKAEILVRWRKED